MKMLFRPSVRPSVLPSFIRSFPVPFLSFLRSSAAGGHYARGANGENPQAEAGKGANGRETEGGREGGREPKKEAKLVRKKVGGNSSQSQSRFEWMTHPLHRRARLGQKEPRHRLPPSPSSPLLSSTLQSPPLTRCVSCQTKWHLR